MTTSSLSLVVSQISRQKIASARSRWWKQTVGSGGQRLECPWAHPHSLRRQERVLRLLQWVQWVQWVQWDNHQTQLQVLHQIGWEDHHPVGVEERHRVGPGDHRLVGQGARPQDLGWELPRALPWVLHKDLLAILHKYRPREAHHRLYRTLALKVSSHLMLQIFRKCHHKVLHPKVPHHKAPHHKVPHKCPPSTGWHLRAPSPPCHPRMQTHARPPLRAPHAPTSISKPPIRPP